MALEIDMDLGINQLRVLGCLIEKQLTTPEYYPLTLSALTNACNQKSNRDPVLSLKESDVLDAIKILEDKYLVREKLLPGSRVAKYEHKLTGTLTDKFGFKDTEVAVLSILFLRGPQTPGEIRTRTQRSCNFKDVHEVDDVLKNLSDKNGTQYVKALARQPGKREIRYCHLFGPASDQSSDQSSYVSSGPVNDKSSDILNHDADFDLNKTDSIINHKNELSELRDEVAQLRQEIETLKAQVNSLLP